MKDPDEVLLPGRNLVLIAFGEDKPEEWIPFTLLGDPLLDPHQSSAIETSVSKGFGMRTNGVAHVVKSPIASRTDWLSPSDCLPFNLR